MIPEFIEEYFVDPIKYSEGYNWVNTFTYGLILIIASYCLYQYLKTRIRMDKRFYYSVSLFVLVGASFRVLKDMDVSESYFLVTPLIYFLVFAITFTSLIVTVKLFGENYYKYLGGIALILFVGAAIILVINATTFNVEGFIYIVATAAAVSVIVYYTSQILALTFVTENIEIMAGHLLDASATSFGLAMYGYFEQHMLPGLFIDVFRTPFVMFPLKIGVVGLALYAVNDVKEENYKNFLKLVILILGAAPGLRDLLRIFFGT
jgi:uncharacterized membrane protein